MDFICTVPDAQSSSDCLIAASLTITSRKLCPMPHANSTLDRLIFTSSHPAWFPPCPVFNAHSSLDGPIWTTFYPASFGLRTMLNAHPPLNDLIKAPISGTCPFTAFWTSFEIWVFTHCKCELLSFSLFRSICSFLMNMQRFSCAICVCAIRGDSSIRGGGSSSGGIPRSGVVSSSSRWSSIGESGVHLSWKWFRLMDNKRFVEKVIGRSSRIILNYRCSLWLWLWLW
jgi:hypothetical protein